MAYLYPGETRGCDLETQYGLTRRVESITTVYTQQIFTTSSRRNIPIDLGPSTKTLPIYPMRAQDRDLEPQFSSTRCHVEPVVYSNTTLHTQDIPTMHSRRVIPFNLGLHDRGRQTSETQSSRSTSQSSRTSTSLSISGPWDNEPAFWARFNIPGDVRGQLSAVARSLARTQASPLVGSPTYCKEYFYLYFLALEDLVACYATAPRTRPEASGRASEEVLVLGEGNTVPSVVLHSVDTEQHASNMSGSEVEENLVIRQGVAGMMDLKQVQQYLVPPYDRKRTKGLVIKDRNNRDSTTVEEQWPSTTDTRNRDLKPTHEKKLEEDDVTRRLPPPERDKCRNDMCTLRQGEALEEKKEKLKMNIKGQYGHTERAMLVKHGPDMQLTGPSPSPASTWLTPSVMAPGLADALPNHFRKWEHHVTDDWGCADQDMDWRARPVNKTANFGLKQERQEGWDAWSTRPCEREPDFANERRETIRRPHRQAVNYEENDAMRRLPPPGRATHQHDAYTSSQEDIYEVGDEGVNTKGIGRDGRGTTSVAVKMRGRDAWMTRPDQNDQQNVENQRFSTKNDNLLPTVRAAPSRTNETGALPVFRDQTRSRTRGAPLRGQPLPPPSPSMRFVISGQDSDLEGVTEHERNDAQRRLPPPGRATRQQGAYTSSQEGGREWVRGGATGSVVDRNGRSRASVYERRGGRDAYATRPGEKNLRKVENQWFSTKKSEKTTDGACSTVQNATEGYLPEYRHSARSKTRGIPPRRHPSPPPSLPARFVDGGRDVGIEGSSRLLDDLDTYKRSNKDVSRETTRYSSPPLLREKRKVKNLLMTEKGALYPGVQRNTRHTRREVPFAPREWSSTPVNDPAGRSRWLGASENATRHPSHTSDLSDPRDAVHACGTTCSVHGVDTRLTTSAHPSAPACSMPRLRSDMDMIKNLPYPFNILSWYKRQQIEDIIGCEIQFAPPLTLSKVLNDVKRGLIHLRPYPLHVPVPEHHVQTVLHATSPSFDSDESQQEMWVTHYQDTSEVNPGVPDSPPVVEKVSAWLSATNADVEEVFDDGADVEYPDWTCSNPSHCESEESEQWQPHYSDTDEEAYASEVSEDGNQESEDNDSGEYLSEEDPSGSSDY